ncbi:MAG: phosphoribosylformylglycinamidine synthase I [Candidatus Aegiribacteria sp.]|nr:phosphoribosylformylglycinamidine synthase I [Candidatus Aegiribacteria sp.]
MKSVPLVAVIQFPGSNCEYETSRVINSSGMASNIYRWNQWQELKDSRPDAYVLPGGFSFQDRVRAGAVAAKEKIMDLVFSEAADGKPVLGICNGAQILVESGLVPGWERGKIESALASNHISGRSGYLSRWIFVQTGEKAQRICPWLGKIGSGVIPIPIAHAEGRFVFSEGDRDRISDNTALSYCDDKGTESSDYPVNPNGSYNNLAGIMNDSGNVLAMMPHPERAFWLWQLPPWIPGKWGNFRIESIRSGSYAEEKGPGSLFFMSLSDYFGGEQE